MAPVNTVAPATNVPALSNGQTAADLAETAGVSQAEVMAEQARFPDLNPDALIGNIKMNQQKKEQAVITSAPAVEDLTKKAGAVDVMDQQIQAKQKQFYRVGGDIYEAGTGRKLGPTEWNRDWTGRATEVTAPEEPADEAGPAAGEQAEPPAVDAATQAANDFSKNIEEQNAKYDQDQKDYQAKITSIMNGTFPLTADQQQQLQNIKDQFAEMVAEQKAANKNYEAGMKQAGIAAGRNMYAPEIEMGNIKAAVDSGLKAVRGIEIQQLAAVQKAKQAIMDNDFKLLSAVNDSIEKANVAKTKAIEDMYKATQDAIEAARQGARDKLDQRKFDFEILKYANQPALDADKRVQEAIVEFATKYPDAGITAEDTLATATEKVKQSAIYQAELAKTQAEAEKKATGDAPIFRPAAPDEFGNPQYQQWNPETQTWDLTTSAQVEQYAVTPLQGTDVYSTAVNGAVEKVAGTLQVAQQKAAFKKSIVTAMEQGNPRVVVDAAKTAAKDAMGVDYKSRLEGSEKALDILPKIKDDLAQYINGGGSLNIFSGTIEDIAGKLGTVKDPELRRLASEIQTYLMDYRRSMTGAQFSESETNEYKYILPTIKDTLATATARIDGFIKSKSYDIDASYSTLLGKENWAQLKQMNKYENTIDRSEYDNLVSQVGQEKADKALRDSKTWIVDSPKADAPAAGGDIKPLSVGGKTINVSSQIADKIASADADYFKATGKHLQVNQSFRTREQQEKLYAELSPKGARVAKPGTSFHEKGLAIDVTNWKEAEPYLRKYGLVNPMADDKGHFSFGEFS